MRAIVALTVLLLLSKIAEAGSIQLNCKYAEPRWLGDRNEKVAAGLSSLWSGERGLFLVYNYENGEVGLDPQLESVFFDLAKVGGKSPFSALGDEFIQFSIDVSWVKDVRLKFRQAEMVVAINRYTLESDMTLGLLGPADKPPLTAYWVRSGECVTRKL